MLGQTHDTFFFLPWSRFLPSALRVSTYDAYFWYPSESSPVGGGSRSRLFGTLLLYLRDVSSRCKLPRRAKVYPHASGRRRGAGALVRTPEDNKTSSPSYRLEVASRRRVSDGGRSVSGALGCLEQSVRQAPPRAAPGGSQWTCRPAATLRDPTSAHSCGQRSTEYAGEP